MVSLVDKRNKRSSRLRYYLRQECKKSSKPRLSVFISNRHVHAQLIDDVKSITLCGATSVAKKLEQATSAIHNMPLRQKAIQVGTEVAQKAKALGVVCAVFDKGHKKYHGILATVADSAREAGLSC